MHRWLVLLLLLAGPQVMAEEESRDDAPAADSSPGNVPAQEGPKTMAGMSILGNEEAPKALVIVPWKSSEMGDNLGMRSSLDDLAKPVDREVFVRELRYYQIRAEN